MKTDEETYIETAWQTIGSLAPSRRKDFKVDINKAKSEMRITCIPTGEESEPIPISRGPGVVRHVTRAGRLPGPVYEPVEKIVRGIRDGIALFISRIGPR